MIRSINPAHAVETTVWAGFFSRIPKLRVTENI